jgi:hypothetical protein
MRIDSVEPLMAGRPAQDAVIALCYLCLVLFPISLACVRSRIGYLLLLLLLLLLLVSR